MCIRDRVKTLARKSALSYKAQNNAIIVVEDFTFEAPKTKDFVAMTKNLKAVSYTHLYKVESDEATGLREIIIIESKDKTKVPTAHILTEDGDLIRTYNLPVGGHAVSYTHLAF